MQFEQRIQVGKKGVWEQFFCFFLLRLFLATRRIPLPSGSWPSLFPPPPFLIFLGLEFNYCLLSDWSLERFLLAIHFQLNFFFSFYFSFPFFFAFFAIFWLPFFSSVVFLCCRFYLNFFIYNFDLNCRHLKKTIKFRFLKPYLAFSFMSFRKTTLMVADRYWSWVRI